MQNLIELATLRHENVDDNDNDTNNNETNNNTSDNNKEPSKVLDQSCQGNF